MGELDWTALIETAITSPGRMGDTYNRFHNYSYMNQMLLMMQGVREPVATYKAWQKLGRQVLKGSKAKEIVRPIFIEKKDDAGDVESRRLRFKAVKCIFALSDTEGPELPPVEIPAWNVDVALEKLGIERVPFTGLNGNVQGWSRLHEVAINPVAADPTATLFHEVGHVTLGHTEPERLGEYATHRGLMEFQAEATAYLSMNELDELTDERASESRAYIQGWLHKDRPADVAIRQVFKATDTILKAGRPEVAYEPAS